MSLVEHALKAVARGWWVIPLWGISEMEGGILRCACPRGAACDRGPGKHPHGRLAPHGLRDASNDPAQVRRWWGVDPGANIGIVCGPSGLLVIDLDGKQGVDNWELAEARHGEQETYIVGTGRNLSYHLYFHLPDDAGLRPGAGRLGAGIDHRCGASYVVAAGSRHASGRLYVAIDDGAERVAPSWLIVALRATQRVPAGEGGEAGEGGTDVGEGERNAYLTRSLGWLRHEGWGLDALCAAALARNREWSDPLDDGEVVRVARSVWRYPSAEQSDAGRRGQSVDQRRAQILSRSRWQGWTQK
jgi:hypothetical protein